MDRIAELESQVHALQKRADEFEIRAIQAEKALEREAITRHVREAALAEGVKPEALDDVTDRAIRAGQWKLASTGKLYRVEDSVPVVDTAGDYVTPRAWLRSLKTEADFYFSDSDQGQQTAGAKNPWTKEYWNLSRQAEVYRESPDAAAKMAEAAGSRVGSTRPSKA